MNGENSKSGPTVGHMLILSDKSQWPILFIEKNIVAHFGRTGVVPLENLVPAIDLGPDYWRVDPARSLSQELDEGHGQLKDRSGNSYDVNCQLYVVSEILTEGLGGSNARVKTRHDKYISVWQTNGERLPLGDYQLEADDEILKVRYELGDKWTVVDE